MKSRRPARRTRNSNIRVEQRARRRKQRHVLDVRVPSTRESQLRRHAQARFALKWGAVVLLFIATVGAGKSVVSRALSHGDRVMLTRLDVRTTGTLTRGRILGEAKVAEGDNLLRIDLDAVRERLVALPQVAEVEVTRVLPGALTIAVEERVPLAWVACDHTGIPSHTSNGGFLLDTSGYVFACEVLLREYVNLPVVEVHGMVPVRDGLRADRGVLRSVIELVRKNHEAVATGGWTIREIELARDFALVVRYHNDAEVVFAPSDLGRQVSDLVLIAGHAAGTGRHIRTLNLIMERNIPVTYFEGDGDGAGPGATGEGGEAAPPAAEPEDERTRQLRGILGA